MRKKKTTKRNKPAIEQGLGNNIHVFLIAHPFGMYATSSGGKTVFPDKAAQHKTLKEAQEQIGVWRWTDLGFIWIKEFMADSKGKLLWHITTCTYTGANVDLSKMKVVHEDMAVLSTSFNYAEHHRKAMKSKGLHYGIITIGHPIEFYNAEEGVWTDDPDKATWWNDKADALEFITQDGLSNFACVMEETTAREWRSRNPSPIQGYRLRKPSSVVGYIGTETSKYSSAKPNIQSIPKKACGAVRMGHTCSLPFGHEGYHTDRVHTWLSDKQLEKADEEYKKALNEDPAELMLHITQLQERDRDFSKTLEELTKRVFALEMKVSKLVIG